MLADVPHIVKNLRNHIVNGQDIVLPDDVVNEFGLPCNVVSVAPLNVLVKYQANKDLKPAPKLTEKHLQPSHFEKMKVSHAMAIFSNSVSAAIRLLVDAGVIHNSALTTAWFLETVNHWFDLMSSRHPVMALSKFDDAKYLKAVEFLRKVSALFRHVNIGNKGCWKPVQTGIILSTTSMLLAQEKLLNQTNFKFVLTSRFSQDCLENLFSCVRRKNATPTDLEFKNSLRVLTVAQYLKGCDTGSYELDDGSFVADFLDIRSVQPVSDRDVCTDVMNLFQPLVDSPNESIVFDRVELNCLCYLAGYVVSCVKKHEDVCEICIGELCASTNDTLDTDITQFVREKEYRSGCLVACSQLMFDLIVSAETTFRTLQHTLLHSRDNVKQHLVQKIIEKN